MWVDYILKEKNEEGDSLAIGIVCMQQFNDSKNIQIE